MLLGTLSEKARANIERTNRGDKPLQADAADTSPVRERSNPKGPNRSGAFDPTSIEEIYPDFFTRIVAGQDNQADQKRYSSEHVHVSEMLRGICPRRVRFSDQDDTPEYDSVTGGHRVMWRIGRAVEAHIRESYIKAVKAKGVIGKWICKCGQTEYEGYFQPKHRACPHCRTAPDSYGELTMKDEESGIAGNPDMIIRIGVDGLIYVVETKSMNGEDFDELSAPVPDHTYQAASYRKLLELNGYDVAEEVFIIYCTKKFKFGNPYKEFRVNVNTTAINNVLDGAWETAREVKQHRVAGTIPARRLCNSIDSPMAKKCPKVTDCFMRD